MQDSVTLGGVFCPNINLRKRFNQIVKNVEMLGLNCYKESCFTFMVSLLKHRHDHFLGLCRCWSFLFLFDKLSDSFNVAIYNNFLNRCILKCIDECMVLLNLTFEPIPDLAFEIGLSTLTKCLSTKRLDSVECSSILFISCESQSIL